MSVPYKPQAKISSEKSSEHKEESKEQFDQLKSGYLDEVILENENKRSEKQLEKSHKTKSEVSEGEDSDEFGIIGVPQKLVKRKSTS